VKLYVGTSGYAFKEWKGSFYPKDLPAKDMLHYYGERFRAVEINNTMYRFPRADDLKAWASAVPAGFKFVIKAHQRITHRRRLKDVTDTVNDLITVTATLKKRLGALLFQLPPNFKNDAARLREFLPLVPSKTRAAFEFRHESWFDDEVFDLLRRHHVALCIAEAEDGVEVPFVATADWGYVRLRLPHYSDTTLKQWAKRIQTQKWKEAFIFFKHEDAGKGPKLAKRFLELAAL
jgi:uncharacterized protein YecE (DUF72 family)